MIGASTMDQPKPTLRPCAVEGCDRYGAKKDFCHAHYERVKRTGSPGSAPIRRRDSQWGAGLCSVEGCDAAYFCKGMCSPHHRRLKMYGDPLHVPIPRGHKYLDDKGYVKVSAAGRAHKPLFEHRLMWEARYGPLQPGQTIHHKNGVRDDNRYENLEVWDTRQPKGQRPEDKVEHAVEMLRRYAPERLAT